VTAPSLAGVGVKISWQGVSALVGPARIDVNRIFFRNIYLGVKRSPLAPRPKLGR